jgi:hypothetical protein
MSQLVPESCTLRFEEHEFVEFFGVSAPLDEDSVSFTYELRRDGMRLVFTVLPIEGGVSVHLYREGVTEPVVVLRAQDCTHSRFVNWGSLRCLEIGRPERPTSEQSAPVRYGLRIFVDPHFKLEPI